MQNIFGKLGIWPAKKEKVLEPDFDSPFSHPVYRYSVALDDICRDWKIVRELGEKARSGKKLTLNEQMELIKKEAAVLARLRFIATTAKK